MPKFIKPKTIFTKTKLKISMYDFPGPLALKYGSKLVNLINNAIYKAKELNLNIEIDLTNNQGGYEPIMIIALQSLFNDNDLLYREIDRNHIIKNFYLTSYTEYDSIKFKKFKYIDCSHIDVIISDKTESAGEIVALCFVKNNREAKQLNLLPTHAYNHILSNGDIVLFTTGVFIK